MRKPLQVILSAIVFLFASCDIEPMSFDLNENYPPQIAPADSLLIGTWEFFRELPDGRITDHRTWTFYPDGRFCFEHNNTPWIEMPWIIVVCGTFTDHGSFFVPRSDQESVIFDPEKLHYKIDDYHLVIWERRFWKATKPVCTN